MVSFKAVLSLVVVAFLAHEGGATLKGDFCSDVSFWDVLGYRTETRQCCDSSTMQKQCVWKEEEVCAEVTEMKCSAVAWADCTPSFSSGGGTKCNVQYKDYALKACQEVEFTVPHRKKVPECRQVTKENCVTDWDIDANGNKVWAGTEKCEPVTWEECDIVEKDVEFPAVKTDCGTVSHIKYADFVQGSSSGVKMNNNCQVKSSTDCRPVKSTKCATVKYEDCNIEPTACTGSTVPVYIPNQEKVHQKKCLT